MRRLVYTLFWSVTGAALFSCSANPDDFDYSSSEAPVSGRYRLRIVHSGKCVDVAGGTSATQNGANIHQWSCHSGTNQQWEVRDLGGGRHQLAAVHSGRCMDIAGGSSAVSNGATLHQWGCHSGNNQRFDLISRGSGQYQLRAVHSGKCLDVASGSTANGANIHQWTCHNGNNQRFVLEPVGGGSGGTGGSTGSGGGSSGTGGGTSGDPCSRPGLVWKNARKTHYTSYPDPGSEECVKYNGCTWAGYFAGCSGKKSEAWVSAHNIAAAFPDFGSLKLHDLCLRKGSKSIVVTVYDTCADSDCSGCCTQNLASYDQLIDLESYTNNRWGVPDGVIEWADLGPTQGGGCN